VAWLLPILKGDLAKYFITEEIGPMPDKVRHKKIEKMFWHRTNLAAGEDLVC